MADDEVYGFASFDDMRMVARATQQTLRQPRNQPQPDPGSVIQEEVGHFINESTAAIPSYGCIQIVGKLPNGKTWVCKESQNYGAQGLHRLNGPYAVPPGGEGTFQTSYPALARVRAGYNTEQYLGYSIGPLHTTVTADYGTVGSNHFLCQIGSGGFQVVGIVPSADRDAAITDQASSLHDVVWVDVTPGWTLFCKTTAAINQWARGTVYPYWSKHWPQAAPTADPVANIVPGQTSGLLGTAGTIQPKVNVFCPFGSVAISKYCRAVWVPQGAIVSGAPMDSTQRMSAGGYFELIVKDCSA